MNHLFCFGLGYTAQRLVEKLSYTEPGLWKFTGTNRSPISGPVSEHSIIFDDCLVIPDDVTHILISIPPKDDSEVVYDLFITQITKLKKLEWLGYLSATSVYGDQKGAWVDETSDTSNCGEIGQRRLTAEKMWLDTSDRYGVPVHIFRLAGIYGPGRSALETAISNKMQIIDAPDIVFSRVHVDDIVQTLIFSIEDPQKKGIYNISDDYPCSPREVTEYACKLLGIKPPKALSMEEAQLSEMGKYFFSQSKKVSNSKIKKELGVDLLYPTYKEGLEEILLECSYSLHEPGSA